MRYFREIMARSTSFIKSHGLISDDSGIMVGLSGGKDSLTLLMILSAFFGVKKQWDNKTAPPEVTHQQN